MNLGKVKQRGSEVDLTDSALIPGAVAASFVVTGLATVQVGSYALSDNLTEVGGQSITYAFALAIASFAVMYVTNNPNLNSLEQEETAALGIGLVTLVGAEFIPAVSDTLSGNPSLQVISALLISAAGYMLAYY